MDFTRPNIPQNGNLQICRLTFLKYIKLILFFQPLKVPPMVLRDQNEIVNHLKIGTTTMERLDFPTVVAAAEKT